MKPANYPPEGTAAAALQIPSHLAATMAEQRVKDSLNSIWTAVPNSVLVMPSRGPVPVSLSTHIGQTRVMAALRAFQGRYRGYSESRGALAQALSCDIMYSYLVNRSVHSPACWCGERKDEEAEGDCSGGNVYYEAGCSSEGE